jgi:hypothetical protein
MVCWLPLLMPLIDAWAFPWYGNPDQDLVFLRDGLRLATGLPPGYADHPDFLQMLLVSACVPLFRAGSVLGVPLLQGSPGALLDADWQRLFVVSKLLNQTLMSALIFANAALLVGLLGRPGGGVRAGAHPCPAVGARLALRGGSLAACPRCTG